MCVCDMNECVCIKCCENGRQQREATIKGEKKRNEKKETNDDDDSDDKSDREEKKAAHKH